MIGALEQLLLGRTLAGRYEVHEVIGRGGMSVVYRGTDRTLGRPVAVKLISLPADTEEMRAHLRERFRREAGSAASIPPHPNVVQVYDYGTDPELDVDFIVMELLVGRDLKEALATSPPSREEAVRILREAARGLSAGHRAGIVHRDVKPANVFLVGRERFESVRLLDFGIAKPLASSAGDDDLTLGGQLPHSPAYAPPEQVDPDRAVTFASDVYQLGLIGYELLTGERPYDDRERERIRAGEEVAPRGGPEWEALPPPLRETVAQALRTRPEERFPDAAAFAEALSAALDDDRTLLEPRPSAPARPVEAPVGGASPPPPPPRRRRTVPPRGGQRGKVLAGLVVLLALAGATWALTRGGDPADAAPAPTAAQGTATASTPPPEPTGGEADSIVPAESAEERYAVQVQETIVRLNEAWVAGDLDAHLAHYADRVDFYSADDAPRSRIREERERDLRTFNRDRTIRIVRQAVTFPAPGRALALVDKEWTFVGDELRRMGAGQQEMVLEERDGRWVVVSERMRRTTRSSQERT